MARKSIHPTFTKSYAIDQIEDIEELRKVAHRMWEAFYAAHKQHAHSLGALLNGECEECDDAMTGERENGCEQHAEWQRKVNDGFGSV